MEESITKYDEFLLQMQSHEEEIIFIKGHPFIIRPATENDVIRLGKGYFCMD